jgi:hypothetical protein
MHHDVSAIIACLDEAREQLRLAIEAVPPGSRALRPGPERWSVAEIVEHLALVETQYTSMIVDSIRGLPADRPVTESVREPLPERLEALMANRSARRPAPEAFLPTGVSFDAAWAMASDARSRLRTFLVASSALPLHEAVYDHPRFGMLNACQWVEFVAAHERRHVAQVKEHGAGADDRSER